MIKRFISCVLITLVLLQCIPLSDARAAYVPVAFSEVMTANASAVMDDYGNYSDWFEIVNDGERAINLTGWMVMRGTDKLDVFTFGRQSIAPGEHAVVFCSGYSQNNPAYVCHAPFGLTATGEVLTLMDGTGQIIDTIDVPSLARNQSYAFMDGAWQATMQFTPGMENTAQNHEAYLSSMGGGVDSDVIISEVMIKNRAAIADDHGEYSDYIELHNTSSKSINLKGYTLSDDETAPGKFTFPDVTVPADGYLLIFASGTEQLSGQLHTGFKLSEGETVLLCGPSGAILCSTTPQTAGADQAWSLVNGSYTASFPATPGYANDADGLAAEDQITTSANTSGITITEIMASTTDTALSSGAYDWIELHNSTDMSIDLSGWGLSDSSSRPRKWQFPSGASIGAGQYMLVFCSGKDTRDSIGYHTSFSLSMDGGYSVTLASPDGAVVDRLPVPEQYQDISYGRAINGLKYFTEPTPKAANTTYGYSGRAQQAQFSIDGGMYDAGETVTVSLTAPTGGTIYYTTDCSEPTSTSTPYTGPITLNETTILRTIVYSQSEIPSLVSTQSYFFGVSHTMRVVSLVTDPANLWDYNTGIYVMGPNAWAEAPYGSNNNGANFWMDWEKPGNVEIFTSDGDTLISQGCGVKLQGQYSRQQDQKAFKIIARNAYGSNRFRAALFSDRPYTEYQSFILRASGQDSGRTRVRDVLQTSLADATDVMYQAAEMCIVYLNGEYWGHYNMRERINKYSIAQWMGWTSDPDDIDIVKANRNVMQGSDETFATLLNWIKNEGGATAREKKETLTQADYDEILDHISQVVDVDNYLDYVIIQVFTGNTDLLNVKRYRSANEDGLWRWILFDMDWGFHYSDTNSMRRWLDPEGAGSGKKTDNTLFVELMKNPAIQDRFLRRYNELFVSTFNPDEIFSRMNALYQELEPEIDQHLARWNGSRSVYDREWKNMRDVIYARYDLMTGYIKDTFNFTDEQMEDYFGDMLRIIEQYKEEHS